MNLRGFELFLTREQWGYVLDGLIEHVATLRKRKGINSESTADATVCEVEALIGTIGDKTEEQKLGLAIAENDGRTWGNK
jgi:hypothetical protein